MKTSRVWSESSIRISMIRHCSRRRSGDGQARNERKGDIEDYGWKKTTASSRLSTEFWSSSNFALARLDEKESGKQAYFSNRDSISSEVFSMSGIMSREIKRFA